MISLFAVIALIVALAVLVHYEFLYHLTVHLSTIGIQHRQRILLGVFIALIAHSIEVCIFALAFYFMHHAEGWGELSGNFSGTLMDCVYFSTTTFTTLGYGDIEPLGPLRHLTGIESLTGLVLITWTASFLFLEMQRYWTDK